MEDQNKEPDKEIDITSKINSAGLINLRLHQLWDKTHDFASNGENIKWNTTLDRIWCELAGDTKENDEWEKGINSIDKEINEVGLIALKKQGFQAEFPKEQIVQHAKANKLLKKKEIFLRRLQNKQGKGTAYQDADEENM